MNVGRPPKYPELQDPEWLRARYVVDGLSADQIAEMIDFDCTTTTVRNWLRRHGIPLRPSTEQAPNGRRGWRQGDRVPTPRSGMF